jgi:hypothetical protein
VEWESVGNALRNDVPTYMLSAWSLKSIRHGERPIQRNMLTKFLSLDAGIILTTKGQSMKPLASHFTASYYKLVEHSKRLGVDHHVQCPSHVAAATHLVVFAPVPPYSSIFAQKGLLNALLCKILCTILCTAVTTSYTTHNHKSPYRGPYLGREL